MIKGGAVVRTIIFSFGLIVCERLDIAERRRNTYRRCSFHDITIGIGVPIHVPGRRIETLSRNRILAVASCFDTYDLFAISGYIAQLIGRAGNVARGNIDNPLCGLGIRPRIVCYPLIQILDILMMFELCTLRIFARRPILILVLAASIGIYDAPVIFARRRRICKIAVMAVLILSDLAEGKLGKQGSCRVVLNVFVGTDGILQFFGLRLRI